MVLKFNIVCTLGWFCGIIILSLMQVDSTAIAQNNAAAEAPFIGFRPFDGSGQSVPAANAATLNNAQSQATRPTTITPEQTPSAYPYPASAQSAYGPAASSQIGTAERASLGGRLPSTSTPTGGLNVASGTAGGAAGVGSQTAGVAANVDTALQQRYQQEIQQQQAWQQNQQYQRWLAQQQQFLQQRQLSTVGFRAPQQNAAGNVNTTANSAAQPTPAARPTSIAQPASTTRPASASRQNTQVSVARPTRPKLNESVVQQVSSTATINRDRSVARAGFSTAVATNSTSVAKQATSASNTVAKPQCCCVPQNCCVAAPAQTPVTPAPVFRPQAVPQAANQVPTLAPGVPGGFLGQSGSSFQVQPQAGFQFQPGLGVPQFSSTGATGGGLFGTGAYTPLLPIVSAQGARLGQGIIGQPTAYIDGQPIRNLLRYISP